MLYSLVLPGVGLPFFVSKRIRTLSVESAAVCGQQSLEMRRWGGVPAPLSQPAHRGSFTNVFKKEESWVKITAWWVLQVSLPLCVLGKKKKKRLPIRPPRNKLTVCSHFTYSQNLRQTSSFIATCRQSGLGFYSISWHSAPGCPKTFSDIICVSE